MAQALQRAPLLVTLYQARPGVWAARGELTTAYGPVVFIVEAPAELVNKYMQTKFGDEIGGDGDYIGQDYFGFLGKLRKRITGVQRWAVNQVVKQAVNVSKAALPSNMAAIARSVAQKTGVAPRGSAIDKAFALASKAFQGDQKAKDLILGLAKQAKNNPVAKAALTTVLTTAKLLPNVKPVVQAAEQLAKGNVTGAIAAAVPPQVQAGLALARGDYQGAVQAMAGPQMAAFNALQGNPQLALAPWLGRGGQS